MISAAKTYPPRLLPLRLPRVCVAITASDPTELVEKAESLTRDNSFLEFRLDYISKPALALPKIKHFIDTHPLVGLCMGEQGLISRVLGVRAGSVFTFASASAGEETAPGQVTAQELRSVYRIESVDAATRVYGVAGDPVAHSLSPAIMNAALRRENVNGVYLALHAKSLKDLLSCIRDIPIHGLSITMPYKESIVAHLDNTDSYTAKIGACNTVVRAQDGKLYGFNTDIAGVVRPLEQRIPLENAKILVLGAGGAARAAVFGLKERGAEVYILNRSAAPAQKLAHQARARIAKRPRSEERRVGK